MIIVKMLIVSFLATVIATNYKLSKAANSHQERNLIKESAQSARSA